MSESDRVVMSLFSALQDGKHGLSAVPKLVVRAIEIEAWRKRRVEAIDADVEFSTFEAFAKAAPPKGLGTSLDMLRGLCRDEPAALDAIDRATRSEPGNHGERAEDGRFKSGADKSNDNNVINRHSPVGNQSAKALRTLRTKRPDLHARVLAGELSPHAAMVEAGFRHKTITVPIDDVESAARILLRHLDGAALIEALMSQIATSSATHGREEK